MIRYDRQAFGPYNVANILRFLIGVQNEVGDKKHRETLQRMINQDNEGKTTKTTKIQRQKQGASLNALYRESELKVPFSLEEIAL